MDERAFGRALLRDDADIVDIGIFVVLIHLAAEFPLELADIRQVGGMLRGDGLLTVRTLNHSAKASDRNRKSETFATGFGLEVS
jgi:hypothetical protein